MQTKTFIKTIIAFLYSFGAHAQNHNPYKDIGKNGKVLTLTNGKYEEFFDEDSIQQIGTALVNINTMKVVKFQFTKEEQKIIDNSANSRFLSIDPLTSSFAMLTPYQYASNRPIDGIDVDGKEWATQTQIGRTGTAIQMQTTFTVRVKVENKSNFVNDPNIIKAKAEVYKSSVEGKYKNETTFLLYGIPFKVIFKTEVVLDYTPPTKDDGAIGHLVFDDRTSTSSTTETETATAIITTTATNSTPGLTVGEINNFTTYLGITMDGKTVNDEDMASTVVHEAGHSASLNHPWELKDIEKDILLKLDQDNEKTADVTSIKNNIMNSAGNKDLKYRSNGGDELLLGQLFVMWKRILDQSYYKPSELKGTSGPNDPGKTSTEDEKNKTPQQ